MHKKCLSDLILKCYLEYAFSSLPQLLILFTDSEITFLFYINFFSPSSHIQSVKTFLSNVFVSRGLAYEGMIRGFTASSSFFIVFLVANL